MRLLLIIFLSALFFGSARAEENVAIQSQSQVEDQSIKQNDDSNASFYRRWGYGRGYGRGYGPIYGGERLAPIIEEVNVDVVQPVPQDTIKVIRPVIRKVVVPGRKRTVFGSPVEGGEAPPPGAGAQGPGPQNGGGDQQGPGPQGGGGGDQRGFGPQGRGGPHGQVPTNESQQPNN